MMRVLVAVTPRMYREAIALSIHSNRAGLDVRVAPPEAVEAEVSGFGPHLLVHNDTAPIPRVTLEGVKFRVEVMYSDSMNARASLDGHVEHIDDVSTQDLLRAVDLAAEWAGGETTPI